MTGSAAAQVDPVAQADPTVQLAELAPRQADAEALAEVYRQGVDTAAASPGVTEYFRDTIIYGIFRVYEWLEGMSGLFAWLSWSLVQVVLTGVLLVLAGWFVFILLRRILSRRREKTGDGRLQAATPGRPAVASRDWAAELRDCLERGDVAAALEALWWWLATQLGASDADPSWTSRELLIHAGRSDLRRPVRRLDHMIYGPQPPRTGDVDELWNSLRSKVERESPTLQSKPLSTQSSEPGDPK